MRTAIITAIAIFSLLHSMVRADEPVFDIPDATWEPLFFDSINALTKKVDWTPLREKQLATNEIEVRIWVGFGLLPLQCFLLHNDGTNWTGLHAQGSFRSQPTITSTLKSKISWSSFWDHLVALDILTLPDSSSLPNEQSVFDGESYVVEIGRHNNYRTYEYSNPQMQTWPEANNISKIVDSLYNILSPEIESEDAEHAPPEGRGEAPRP